MTALLIFHIFVALGGLFYSIYAFFKPTKFALHVIYGLLGLTIASGSFLIYLKPAHMTQTCVEGLVYVGVMLVGIVAVRNKLSRQAV